MINLYLPIIYWQVQLTWRKDGHLIEPQRESNNKHQISASGSLFIRNITIFDGGRYECSVKNEYGRTTASVLVTVK